MKKIEVPLFKRKGKFALYLIGFVLFTWTLIFWIIALFREPFSYWTAGGAAIFAIGSLVFGKGLYDYFTQKMPVLVVESDGKTIEFYTQHSTGTANRSDKIILADMKRFYHVKKRTRLMLTELSFEFVPKSGIFKEDIDPLPALSDINELGITMVLQFVAESAPEIEIGYVSALATLFKK